MTPLNIKDTVFKHAVLHSRNLKTWNVIFFTKCIPTDRYSAKGLSFFILRKWEKNMIKMLRLSKYHVICFWWYIFTIYTKFKKIKSWFHVVKGLTKIWEGKGSQMTYHCLDVREVGSGQLTPQKYKASWSYHYSPLYLSVDSIIWSCHRRKNNLFSISGTCMR